MPQPLDRSREDYFSAFGVPRAFSQDLGAIEKQFYRISRALHPDRFLAMSAEARKASIDRMSFVNQAYATLRDPAALRTYMLALNGVEAPKQGGQMLPAELAESWFELQDAMSEDPAAAKSRVVEFDQELTRVMASLEEEIRVVEKAFDETGARETLERLAVRMQRLNYLKSLARQVERLGRPGSGCPEE